MTVCEHRVDGMLAAYIEGTLSEEERAEVEQHISVCVDCQQRERHLRKILFALRNEAFHVPESVLIAYACKEHIPSSICVEWTPHRIESHLRQCAVCNWDWMLAKQLSEARFQLTSASTSPHPSMSGHRSHAARFALLALASVLLFFLVLSAPQNPGSGDPISLELRDKLPANLFHGETVFRGTDSSLTHARSNNSKQEAVYALMTSVATDSLGNLSLHSHTEAQSDVVVQPFQPIRVYTKRGRTLRSFQFELSQLPTRDERLIQIDLWVMSLSTGALYSAERIGQGALISLDYLPGEQLVGVIVYKVGSSSYHSNVQPL